MRVSSHHNTPRARVEAWSVVALGSPGGGSSDSLLTSFLQASSSLDI